MTDRNASYNAISEITRLQKENQQLREDKTELLAELYSLAFDEGVFKNRNALSKWTANFIQTMKDDAMKTAKLMWDAYAVQAGRETFDGKPLPTWDELGQERQSCWVAAASVAADRIEQLEAALRRYETVYRVSRVYPHEMPDGEVFGVPSFTDGKHIFPLLSDEYDLYVARAVPEGKKDD